MKTLLFTIGASIALTSSVFATGQQVRFALTVHSEVAGGGSNGIPVTPNFTSPGTTKVTYLKWREALINFAKQCEARSLPWQFQTDYNFLEGVRRFEVFGGSGFDATIMNGTFSDSSLSAYTSTGTTFTTNTSGKNVIKYLHENLGVNLDPHSHESNANYNYADVAWLIDVGCDTDATGVVGGHVYVTTSVNYQDWPKFIEDRDGNGVNDGLLAASHAGYRWKPHLLMGGGGSSHKDDPHVSGLWRPQDANNYLVDSPSGQIAAIGHWEQDFFEIDRLLRSLEDNSLPHNGMLWTCGRVMNHRDFVQTGYLTTTAPAILDTIQKWRAAGRFQVKKFEDIYSEWMAAPFNGQSGLYLRPVDNISFSLNWQDFCYTAQSCTELRTLLNHHETLRVPVDVFLTTWQTDILESQSPELLGRLLSSRWVNVAYHIRAPKPYAYDSTKTAVWRTYTGADVSSYESSRLNMVTGMPDTGVSGGFAKLASLHGSTPRLVGPSASDSNSKTTVYPYFNTAGVRMIVQHDSNAAVNLGSTTNVSGGGTLNVRPESYDWRLIETFDPSRATQPVSTTLDEALANARTTSGSVAPYFIGVKLHDNDLFASESAWVAIYMNSRRTPDWDPYNTALWASRLSTTEANRRRSFYAGIVTAAAARRLTLNLMDGRDTLSMLAEDAPRPVGLSVTEVPGGTPVGTTLAEITGGGTESGLRCTYTLVSGTGDDDNADFTINGTSLIQSGPLERATKAVRHLRMRWTDGGGATGERALTLVLGSADDDGDGQPNESELTAGTDPQDAGSRLAVSSQQITGNQLMLTWMSVVGESYHLEYSADLTTWQTVPGSSTGAATSTTSSATVTNLSGARMFFRVAAD
ncbi:MAG: thrombospondin type 3 repeat-containing protein [Verrucomicrobiaceae bacterium]|nr:thrombospondin type 3 repeat-containing protein [Verrucomicrobiaceae bacterium]